MPGAEVSDDGYLVHRRRWRESSLIVTLLTARHGLITVLARSALGGAKSKMQITEFTPHFLVWAGRQELPYLRRAESTARPVQLRGERLLSGLYLNELLMRLQQRHDPEPAVYAAYETALRELATDAPLEPSLRRFEVDLLAASGFALSLEHAIDTQEVIEPEYEYHYLPEQGVLARQTPERGIPVHGSTLLALSGARPWESDTLREAKILMRGLMAHHLGGQPLRTRELFQAKRLEN